VVRQKGQLDLGSFSCANCHTRRMPDGTSIAGTQEFFTREYVLSKLPIRTPLKEAVERARVRNLQGAVQTWFVMVLWLVAEIQVEVTVRRIVIVSCCGRVVCAPGPVQPNSNPPRRSIGAGQMEIRFQRTVALDTLGSSPATPL
jgi:hypothetical protein